MRRGAWHQLGWNHHLAVLEQLENQAGVGVVISPRDLKLARAAECAVQYREKQASVLFDPQWHRPEFSNNQLQTYPTCELRNSVTSLANLTENDFRRLTDGLRDENSQLQTDAVIAPAVLYAAGRPDIVQFNAKLHGTALAAANALGRPCFATAFLAESVTSNMQVLSNVMASITALPCDGWYFAFEFSTERIPSSREAVYRCLRACLLLALTGKPVMHAYAGPMGILSVASGCTAAACGGDQKQWQLCMERWEESSGDGGGDGNAPPRYFSRNLWGTIVVPDELQPLTDALRSRVLHQTPFATVPLPLNWNRTAAKKHNVYTMCMGIQDVVTAGNAAQRRDRANAILSAAVQLHIDIAQSHISLRDDTAAYQGNWRSALSDLWGGHSSDFDFIDFMG